ncbi:curli production assembly protein CsgG [Aliidiomarina taiwanensis]|uniref:Curli production assembly/transport component CsgG n=1 Tax=Aliidiomarina taiwanensis TaxID=946228 RepID=A0A432WW55_9GAMM|nr:CsgG/HfaB family protein [Aliidiomarina taiwanensis]RUO38004.1 curli production assembly protein CsgG [Aliidiomarina taiwanensis]
MRTIASLGVAFSLIGCAATQAPQPTPNESPVSVEQQRLAQAETAAAAEPTRLNLKRKIAVGRLSNETNYGRSLLREAVTGEHDKKISDMFMQAIVNTDSFLIFERPDLALLQNELELNGAESTNMVGVDTLVIGSLTEFGRSTTGERGFFTTSQRQAATAKVDIRLVDVHTGQVVASYTGTGDSSAEQSRTMGFGSVAGYDGSLNDRAIGAAVTAAVEKMMLDFLDKPWTADVLAVEEELLYISGGEAQGVRPGMVFDVMTKGKKVRSEATGTTITLPGKKVGELEIQGLFGESDLDQGAFGQLVSGSVANLDVQQLEIRKGT